MAALIGVARHDRGPAEKQHVRRARRQGDRIARLRAVERRLEISAGWDIDMVSRWGRVGRVKVDLGQRREDLRLSREPRGEQGRDKGRGGDQREPIAPVASALGRVLAHGLAELEAGTEQVGRAFQADQR